MLSGSGEPTANIAWLSHDYHMTCAVCMQASGFGVYVPYCENKPLSESLLWKYAHAEGTFFSVSVDGRTGTACTLVHMLNILITAGRFRISMSCGKG